MIEQQEYIINELAETEDKQLTETLYNELVGSLSDEFRLTVNEARKVVITTLRGLYAQ